MTERVWFTADTHFNHHKIMVCRNAPSLEWMNGFLIDNWNMVVGKNDRIYHLGDFAFGSKRDAHDIFRRLNGQKYLIRGNHDKIGEKLPWVWVKDYHMLKIDGQKIALCHYAFRVWNCSHHGSWNLHGHSHGNLRDTNMQQMDVGVDPNGYIPVGIDRVREYMVGRVNHPEDHHGR